MPRRLGDDPLARARDERAKAAQASATVGPDSGGQGGVPQSGVRSSSRASYNDVFFQRGGEGSNLVIASRPQQIAEALGAEETPEITEISETPEFREVAAAPGIQAGFDVTVEAREVSEGAKGAEVLPAPPVSIIDEVVANLNGSVAGAPSRADGVAEVKAEPASLPARSQAPDGSNDEPEPVPQNSGGFFKRLFGKFK